MLSQKKRKMQEVTTTSFSPASMQVREEIHADIPKDMQVQLSATLSIYLFNVRTLLPQREIKTSNIKHKIKKQIPLISIAVPSPSVCHIYGIFFQLLVSYNNLLNFYEYLEVGLDKISNINIDFGTTPTVDYQNVIH